MHVARRMLSNIPFPYMLACAVLLALFPVLPAYAGSMLTQILIFGIFAMSLNLLVGYTGLFSVGHAAFFGVGGYTAAFLTVKAGISSFWLAAPAGILMAGVVAAIFGIIALRTQGLYFLFITLALGELLSSVAFKWNAVTGGYSGLFGIGYPDLNLPFAFNATSFYYLVLVIFIFCAFLMYRLIKSPFGSALQGIREDERLMQHLGYNTWLHKYMIIIISGAFAGFAGILFGYSNSIIVPSHLSLTMSMTAVLMVMVGGSRNTFGPVIGAVVVLFMQYYASIFTPERWPLILGGVFVFSVMFLRGGISIYLLRLWNIILARFNYASIAHRKNT